MRMTTFTYYVMYSFVAVTPHHIILCSVILILSNLHYKFTQKMARKLHYN